MIAVLNAIVPPVLAALRLPFTIATTFLLVLVADALMLMLASSLTEGAIEVSNFGWALLTSLVASAVTTVLSVVAGTNDDDEYTLRVTQRLARRFGRADPDGRGRASSSWRSTGSRSPCCSARCATATPPRWRAGWPRTRTA